MRCLPTGLMLSVVLLGACAGDIVGAGDDDDGGGGGPSGTDPDDPDAPPDTPLPPQDPDFSDQHPRVYLPRNQDRLVAALGRPAAQRFRSMVDGQMRGTDYYAFQPWFAALLGPLTGEAQYCTWAVAEVDAFVASEEAAIAGGSRPQIAADSYLEVGGRIADVMLTYDWCYPATTAAQRTRWTAYAHQAVWNVWHHEDATWGGRPYPWSGWSVNNPSNNYYYSFVRATMLFGLAARDEHPEAAGWLEFFRTVKMQGELIPTFEADLAGGGSREGTGYGVAMQGLWGIYDIWYGSTGEDLARQTTHTRASLRHLIHAIVPTRDRVAPIGDHARDSTASLFDYHRNYLLELAHLFPEDPAAGQAKWLVNNSSVPQMTQHAMKVYDFLYESPELTEAPLDGLGRVYYGPGTGQVYARSGWDTDATWVNLIAGPYSESHAHRDQGSFMIFKGDWLAYDAGVESHSGIRQEEALHNLVRITENGSTVGQREGTESTVTALDRGTGWVHVAADVTAAYAGRASVQNVERELVFLEPDCVVVFDRVTTGAGTRQIWQLNAPARPALAGETATIAGGAHQLVVRRLAPAAPAVSVFDWSTDGEFSGGYRLEAAVDGGAQQHLNVLSMDGTVTAATRSDADGRTGVVITFADGRSATVRFGSAGVDGTLELRAAGGAVTASEVLGPGVAL